ncbi:uncharacterized protein LOC126326576 [Schistocerca gregaria]|uniref:uncharacterized protein LOC126326576 n=1 Tax=Schistocerca gregaria TaxID=7010 RepID=UPI00211EE6A2|nr:uncharacterized protein LOC126326576 [Schistocerca gregaria]
MKELKSWKGECEDLESTACIEPVLSYAESAGLEVRRVAPLVEFMYFDSIATGCELMKKKLNLSVLQMMVAWIFCGWGASWLELKDKRALTWTCKMCKRKVMMDLSTSKDPEQPGQSEQSVEATGSPTSKLLGFDGSTLVNPLEEHRSFCPWICPLSKSESDSEGWKLCIKALKFVHCFTDRRTAKEADVKDALPRVSQMLDRVKKNRGAAITEAKRA